MTGISFQGIVKYQCKYPWQHPSISIASLHLEEKGKQVANQKVMQSSWAEMRTLCCQRSYISQIWSVGIYWYRDLHCGLLKTEGCRWKILTGREAEKGGLEKIDGQLSERERKLREREQTLQKSAVHWSQQWRGRPRERAVGKRVLSHSQAGIYLWRNTYLDTVGHFVSKCTCQSPLM